MPRDTNVLPHGYAARQKATRRADGPGPEPRPRHRSRRRRPSRWLRLVLVVPALVGLFLCWAVVGAATTPGNVPYSAKLADWFRAHHAAFVSNTFERWYYDATRPPKGGRPKGLNALPTGGGAVTVPPVQGKPKVAVAHLAKPDPVPLVVHPALPGEGAWRPVGPTVDGFPGMYEAQFRADDVYTSELTHAVWIDPLLLRVSLVPGELEPGGTWSHPPYITPAERPTIAAAFNGGFRFQDAHGGFYLDGRTAVPLVKRAASLVIYRSGHIDIGAWGSEVHMTANVAAVLQNLVPMVDHGKVSSSATYNDTAVWGATLGATTVVARSGVGVTADGALVYVAGPALSAKTLAESLQRAGAVRAMTLDINPEWVTFNFFGHPDSTDPSKLTSNPIYPQQQRPSSRYLGPTLEARDFFEVRTPATISGGKAKG